MNKHDILQEITSLSRQKAVSREEVLAAYESGQGLSTVNVPLTRRFALTDILYYLGGIIVTIGLAVLVGQNWDYFNTVTQLLVTLGVGIAAYIIGILFAHGQQESRLPTPFFLISGIMLPIGLYVAFDKAGYDLSSSLTQSLMYLLLLTLFAASAVAFRKIIFTIFTFIFGTFFFFTITDYLTSGAPQISEWDFWQYRILAVGLSYLLLGYYVSQTKQKVLRGIIYSFGSLAFFGAALSLGGWSPNQSTLWETAFPFLVCAGIGSSIYLKSRSILIFSSLFLLGYILKITREYFSDSVGWPVSLVIVGLALIATGYATFYLNRKYLSRSSTLK